MVLEIFTPASLRRALMQHKVKNFMPQPVGSMLAVEWHKDGRVVSKTAIAVRGHGMCLTTAVTKAVIAAHGPPMSPGRVRIQRVVPEGDNRMRLYTDDGRAFLASLEEHCNGKCFVKLVLGE
eukprot:TRINITY_DN5414_c1_g1_i1.p1 TRINITY_DN5414_c1_g1~~TRINITY_DN5414_c1_g1_i1.p1  ORF type:complete len:122 (+),score=16.54 TRINITY_DN5414_c1_g1_i1:2-367(+)